MKLAEFRSDKKLSEARKHLEMAVELDPGDARSWQYLGMDFFFFLHFQVNLANTEVPIGWIERC